MHTAVGIDVSKGKSTVAVMQPGGVVVRSPFDVLHTRRELNALAKYILTLGKDVRVVLESTGRYQTPVLQTLSSAGIFCCMVNPVLIKKYADMSLRKVKSDPADSMRIANYTLDKWDSLRQYSAMEETRAQLKALNAQMDFLTKQKVATQNYLVSLLDMTYPGVNGLFSSPARADGSEKWVDYVTCFWHVDCVLALGPKNFQNRYRSFCKRNGYIYQQQKAEEIYNNAKELIACYPRNSEYKALVGRAIEDMKHVSRAVEKVRQRMDSMASTLPEYDIVLGMRGVGKTLGPQLIAEISDISKFSHREALTAFADVDPGVHSSGSNTKRSNAASKAGSARLRKALFMVMDGLMLSAPEDNPVYLFLRKKRAEGKPYMG